MGEAERRRAVSSKSPCDADWEVTGESYEGASLGKPRILLTASRTEFAWLVRIPGVPRLGTRHGVYSGSLVMTNTSTRESASRPCRTSV